MDVSCDCYCNRALVFFIPEYLITPKGKKKIQSISLLSISHPLILRYLYTLFFRFSFYFRLFGDAVGLHLATFSLRD